MRRMSLLAGAALGLASLALAACAGGRSPAAAPNPITVAARQTAPVRHPVLGVDLYAQHNYSAAEVQADGQRTLAYIKNVLKADAVGIVWDFFVTNDQSDTVMSTADTLTPANVEILTNIARQYHLRVEYRPLIFTTHGTDTWEGRINPRYPAQWITSYVRAERPYLKLAQRLHVPEVVAATEMLDMNRNPLWPSFLRRVSAIYSGITSYTTWDGDYFPANRHLWPVKRFGVDMYETLNLPPLATAAQVTAAWERFFATVPTSILHRTAIDETGIQARAGAYNNPAIMTLPGTESNQVQRNWFHAACATVHRFHLLGVYFWKVDLSDNPAEPATSYSTFEGRPAAAAIAKCQQQLN